MTQKEALDLLKLGHNVFLTGPAGSGKTYLLNQYIEYLHEHGVGVAETASTGIAATHIGGQTIHSWSGMGVRDTLADDELEKVIKNDRIKRNLKKTKVLIIDEVSMLHAHQLDMIERITRHAIDFTKPFGGLQVILCGDFFQLPPVSRGGFGGNDKTFAYECDAWEEGEFQICYLEEQFRQNEDSLLDILNAIRSGEANENVKIPLRARYRKEPEGPVRPTRLYVRNKNVDTINQSELDKLEGREEVYYMETHGFSTLVEVLQRNCMASEELHLKIGAEVMFVKNSVTGMYVNGTRAVVEGFDEDEKLPIVRTFDGRRIVVIPEEWHLEENGSVRATIKQIPLRLAWAITVHKSQGMTLDAAEVDLSDAFEPGMGYVALSRVRTLSGLKLMGLNDMALSVHPKILLHDEKFRNWSTSAGKILATLSDSKKEKVHLEILLVRFGGVKEGGQIIEKKTMQEKIKKKPTIEITADLIPKVTSIESLADKRGLTVGTVLNHLEKLQGMKKLPDISHLKPSKKIFDSIVKEFEKSKDGKLTIIFKNLNEKYSFETLRLVRLCKNNDTK